MDSRPERGGNKQIDIAFTYHAPFGSQRERYEDIRDAAKRFAYFVVDTTPPSREQSLFLTKLEEAVMWANASIARNEKEPS